MAVYKTLAGFIQFDPNDRETPSGQKLRDVVIQPIGQGDAIPSVRITVWDDYAATELNRGDFIAVQGKFTTNTVSGKTYYNLSASDLAVLSSAAKSAVEVENPVEEDDSEDPGF